MERRTFLKGLAGHVVALSVLPGFARADGRNGWLTGVAHPDSSYGAAWIGDDLSVTPLLSSPVRLHDVLMHPRRREICAPARRPGDRLWVALEDGQVLQVDAPKDRHYFGHGAYSRDGSILYAAENDYENERGVIGVYDTNSGYKRLDEISCNGVGPHQMLLFPSGHYLAVANGGILTHPDLGRAKLNLDTMQPNLSLIDLHTQQVIDSIRLPERLHQLSIRHIAMTVDGEIVFGSQDQNQANVENQPLVGSWKPGGAFRFFETPAGTWRGLNGYVGSVAIDHGGRVAAAASPRGGVAMFWDMESAGFIGEMRAPDICGVAPTRLPNEFLMTTGQGEIVMVEITLSGVKTGQTGSSTIRFDNHCRPA